MKDVSVKKPAGSRLSREEKQLITLRRELQSAMQEQLPGSFFRVTPQEERSTWLNLLLMYRLTGSAITTRADSQIFRVGTLRAGGIVRNLNMLRNEEILDASIFHSRAPLWSGGERIEFSKFTVSRRVAPVVRGNIEETGLPIDEIEELFNSLHLQPLPRREIVENLNHFSPSFLRNASPERLASTLDLYLRVRNSDVLLVTSSTLHQRDNPSVGINRILLASCDVPRKGFILKAARVFGRMDILLHRVSVTTVYPPDGGPPVGFSAYYTSDIRQAPLVESSSEFARLVVELKTIKWIPDEDRISRLVGRVDEPAKPTAGGAHLLRLFAHFLYQIFTELSFTRYDLEDVEEIYVAHPEFASGLIQLFHLKLDPWRRNVHDYERLSAQLSEDLGELSSGIFEEDERIRRVFHESIRLIDHIRKTNFFVSDRAALSILLDPGILRLEGDSGYFDPLPEHVYFVFGSGFNGYHFSFAPFVRGGLRTLLPSTRLKYHYDLQGALRECYDLAHTQHLKNKDVPEGGAKGLLIVRPKRQKEVCQRIFVRELTDLLLAEEAPERIPEVVPTGAPGPLLFLGPDENMSDEMIEWIDEYARDRSLVVGSAFMSGHPAKGINHKRYGVTSRGVHTYLKKCLEYSGIDPSTTIFRVKFSGGPDGDVAGNSMKLLLEEFPETAKIVSVIDGTGFGYDPLGFDPAGLLALVREGRGIAAFPLERLHPHSRLLHYSQKAGRASLLFEAVEEGIVQRELSSNEANRMYLDHWYSVEAEVFLPCGGRPNTLNEQTWERYFAGGQPSAPIIVEGANLFISPVARLNLEKRGVLLIRDSSANKCGVITSSYEVLGLLLLGEERFSSLVQEFIPELLALLEERASMEADWLLERHRASGRKESLVELSGQLSRLMQERKRRVAAELALHYDDLCLRMEAGRAAAEMEKPLRRFALAFEDYIPRTFLRFVSPAEAWRSLQPEHRKAIIAVQLALKGKEGQD